VNSAPERAQAVKRRDKYSIRESEGEKIVQKDVETDQDGKARKPGRWERGVEFNQRLALQLPS